MCYYSTTLPRGTFRDVKVGEDLTVQHVHGHGMLRAESDAKIVCVRDASEVHIERVEMSEPYYTPVIVLGRAPELAQLTGKPLSSRFYDVGKRLGPAYWGGAYVDRAERPASDCIDVDGVMLPLLALAPGTKLYTGPKRPSLESKLGVDDPSIALDHNTDKTPTVARAWARVVGLCSVVP